MNRIFKLEIKRAFRNRLFAATLCVAFAICVWHFMENVWIWRMYVYYDTYPLSAYEKWIGADNASVQPLLLYLIMPACVPYRMAEAFILMLNQGMLPRSYQEERRAII